MPQESPVLDITVSPLKTHALSVSVVLPTLNEAENITELIKSIYAYVPDVKEILVVDDNSPDGTTQLVEAFSRQHPHRSIRVEKRLSDPGLTKSLQCGIDKTSGDVVVWMDCDFSMPPALIPTLLRHVDNGYDIAMGSRFVRGGSFKKNTADSADSPVAVFLSRVMNYAIQFILDHSLKDYTSGFIAVRRPVLDKIRLKGNYGEYFIDFIFRTIREGFTVVEVPYKCLPRLRGVSKTGQNLAQFIRLGYRYVRTALGLRMYAILNRQKPMKVINRPSAQLTVNQLEEVRIEELTDDLIPLVAGLHHQILYQTLNSRMGIPFLEDLYGGIVKDPCSQGWVAICDQKVLGFVSATLDLKRTQKVVGKVIPWRERIMAALHILTSLRDLREFTGHQMFFRYCLRFANPFSGILTLGVASRVQGMGIAEKLINKASAFYKQNGISTWYVDTLSNNPKALNFYKKHSYKPVGEFLGNTLLKSPHPSSDQSNQISH